VLVLGFMTDTPMSDEAAAFIDSPHERVRAPDRVGSTRFFRSLRGVLIVNERDSDVT
jgi:hypothetical protein